MKVRIFFLLVVLLLLGPIQSFSASSEKWAYLDGVADQALQMAKQQEYGKARTLLQHFSNEFRNDHSDPSVSMSQLRVLTVSYDEAMNALTSSSLDDNQKTQKMLQFRFAVDAIHSNYQPLWAQMEHSVMNSFQEMKESLLKEKDERFSYQLNQFLNKYEVIYPSLVIDLEPQQIDKLESHITFLQQSKSVSVSEQTNHLNMMEDDLLNLFEALHMKETDPSFIGVSLSIASIIFFTLFYVGWKKYRGDAREVEF